VNRSANTTLLANLTTKPTEGWNTIFIKNSPELMAVEYWGPDGSYGNMAEIKLYRNLFPVIDAKSNVIMT